MSVKKNVNFTTSLKFKSDASNAILIFSNTCRVCVAKSLIPTSSGTKGNSMLKRFTWLNSVNVHKIVFYCFAINI